MADKTFSIDNDLYMTSQRMEHDPTVNRINRQIEELSRTPDLSPELSNQLRSYTIIASQIDAQHNSRRLPTLVAVDLMRTVWDQAVNALFQHGYQLKDGLYPLES